MIRPYKSKDVDKLIALLRLNIPKYFAPSEEKDFIDYLDDYVENYFVVEENGQPVKVQDKIFKILEAIETLERVPQNYLN